MCHNFNIVFDYLLMLIIFPVQNVLIIFQNFNIAFDYLLMLTIFHVPNFFKKVSLSGGRKFSLRKCH